MSKDVSRSENLRSHYHHSPIENHMLSNYQNRSETHSDIGAERLNQHSVMSLTLDSCIARSKGLHESKPSNEAKVGEGHHIIDSRLDIFQRTGTNNPLQGEINKSGNKDISSSFSQSPMKKAKDLTLDLREKNLSYDSEYTSECQLKFTHFRDNSRKRSYLSDHGLSQAPTQPIPNRWTVGFTDTSDETCKALSTNVPKSPDLRSQTPALTCRNKLGSLDPKRLYPFSPSNALHLPMKHDEFHGSQEFPASSVKRPKTHDLRHSMTPDSKDPMHSLDQRNVRTPKVNSDTYVPGMQPLLDELDLSPVDNISRFGRSPVSSPIELNGNSNRSVTLPDFPSLSHFPDQLNSNVANRPLSIAHTSPMTEDSTDWHTGQAEKIKYAQLRQERRRMESASKQPLPPLHLHLSKDGSSPLPPGWQRAPNTRQKSDGGPPQSRSDEQNMYAYYYYHVRTRLTRWDPPVYPWDADPMDTLTESTDDNDPEAPYNWGCASKYAVTHEEIEAMYCRIRQRVLERQCLELLHELAGKPDVPKGASEQNFAVELFTLVHNVLRTYRDTRCSTGRILNDEDLYYLTKKLAQAVILKEIQKLRQAQAATSSSLFSTVSAPEVNSAVQARVSAYVKKYMDCKGSFYRRRLQQQQQHQAPIPPASSQHQRTHVKPGDGRHHHHHHPQTRTLSAPRLQAVDAPHAGLSHPTEATNPFPDGEHSRTITRR